MHLTVLYSVQYSSLYVSYSDNNYVIKLPPALVVVINIKQVPSLIVNDVRLTFGVEVVFL